MLRLKEIVRRRGGAQKVAEITGIPPGTLTKNLSGQTKASFGTIMAVIEALDIDPSKIFAARSPVPEKTIDMINRSAERVRSEQANRAQAVRSPTDFDQPGLITIPRYDEVRPSAGGGSMPISEIPTTRVAFEQRWLNDIGVAPASAVILPAQGDSMEPTIRNGSPLLVDTSKTEVKSGFIYVIAVGDDLLVKRVRRRLDGLVELISDNSAYAPETLGPDSLQQLRVIGRVYAAVSKF